MTNDIIQSILLFVKDKYLMILLFRKCKDF